MKNKTKTLIIESEESSSRIFNSAIRSFRSDAVCQLPQSETLSRSIRQQCQVPSANLNNQPPDQLKQTDRAENFLLHENKELIIFTTASNLPVLKAYKHWFADESFKIR